MSLPIPASEITVGDFLEGYGTVTSVVENRDTISGILNTVGLIFFNGEESLGLDPKTEFRVIQGGPGGLKEVMPDPSNIRPGLAEDHKDGK